MICKDDQFLFKLIEIDEIIFTFNLHKFAHNEKEKIVEQMMTLPMIVY